jgi:hypothetical protein
MHVYKRIHAGVWQPLTFLSPVSFDNLVRCIRTGGLQDASLNIKYMQLS